MFSENSGVHRDWLPKCSSFGVCEGLFLHTLLHSQASWPATLQPLTLVVSPRRGLRHNQWNQLTFYFSVAYVNFLWIKEYICLNFVFPIDSLTLHILLANVEITTLVGRGVSCWWHIKPSKYGIGNINVGVAFGMNVKLLIWKLSCKLMVSKKFILVLNFFYWGQWDPLV